MIAGLRVPALRIIILLSAVKIRVGRIFDVTGNAPLTKSAAWIVIAKASLLKLTGDLAQNNIISR